MMKKRYLLVLFSILLLAWHSAEASQKQPSVAEDNEFAEFEVADEGLAASKSEPAPELTDSPILSEADNKEEPSTSNKANEEDFAFLTNEEEVGEYEGAEKEDENMNEKDTDAKKPVDIRPLTFSDIPSHFRSNWSSYQVEAVALFLILLYVANYVYGKSTNQTIAQEWFSRNRAQLEQQFALVGDDGVSQEPQGGHMFKETDCFYSVWSTGRAGCRGMLTQLKLAKRQDLLGLATCVLWPRPDRVVHKVEFDRGEMDAFVIIFGQRKSVSKAVKEMFDLSTFVSERKSNDRLPQFGLPQSYAVFAEMGEVLPAIIDSTVVQFMRKFEKSLEYIHISDQFSGAKFQEEMTKLPETKPTLIVSYLHQTDDEAFDGIVLNFIFHLVEKLRRYRLSKEGKQKADKKRQNVEESFIRSTHQQRQEQAMARREEKTRERKQRVLEEEDPEKQKRLEKMEQKREAKLRAPKIKQLKIK